MNSRQSGFVGWLRQARRSAWLLVGLCMLYRGGEAVINDTMVPVVDSAAIAQVQQ